MKRKRHSEKDERKRRREMRKGRGGGVEVGGVGRGGGGGLMCPSWGEAGQKWLNVELNWLHYRSSAPESISDISHPCQTASYTPQRGRWVQPFFCFLFFAGCSSHGGLSEFSQFALHDLTCKSYHDMHHAQE